MKSLKWTVLPGLLVLVALVAAACSSGEDSEPASPPAAAAAITITEADDAYFAELAAAQALTQANFSNFGEVFSSSWPVRSALISALLDAGVGNAFLDGLEALKQIEPPAHLQAVHQSIVDMNQRLYDLDSDAADAVRKDDLVQFVLLNGQMGEVSVSGLIALPAGVCNALTPSDLPQNSLCASAGTLPGGEYGKQLSDILRTFEPKFGGARGALGFPLSLDDEELIQVFSTISPEVEAFFAETLIGLESLTPPSSMQDDHQRLIGYLQAMGGGFSRVSASANSGDITEARLIFQSSEEIYCQARGSFTSAEFKVLISIHFQGGPMTCEGQAF